MGRSESVRQAVLKLDGFRCQITGRAGPRAGGDSPLEVDHVKELGMGGSDELDTIDNMITLFAPIHRLKTEKRFFIEKWDRKNGILEIGDETHHIITHDAKALKKLFGVERLWFYSRSIAEKLEPIEARIQGLHMIDGQIARDLYELYRDDNYQLLDPNAKSFQDYCASRGWDVTRARRLIRLWEKALELGIEWPPQMTAADFRKELQNAGEIKPQAYWYIVIKPGTLSTSPARIVRTDDPEALIASLKPTEAAARVGKWFGISAKNETLIDKNNFMVPFDKLEALP